LPDVDAIVAPPGGGSLSGLAAAVRELVQTDLRGRAGDGGALGASLAAGRPFLTIGASFVDGAGGESVLETMWPLLSAITGSIVVPSTKSCAR
jgi:threonine dehydratase